MVVIPGSIADWTQRDPEHVLLAVFGQWQQDNRVLVERVRSGEVECCGECQLPGYHGWCSLLGCPDWAEPAVEGQVTERKNGCPKRFEITAGSQLSAQDQASFGAACCEPAVALTEGE